MKKLFVILLILLFLCGCSNKNSLLGTWERIEEHKPYEGLHKYIIFKENGVFYCNDEPNDEGYWYEYEVKDNSKIATYYAGNKKMECVWLYEIKNGILKITDNYNQTNTFRKVNK